MNNVLVTLIACLASSTAIFAADESSLSRPNMIFILADDLGIGNVSCYGADNYQTPHIDQLAGSGTRFTHADTAAIGARERLQATLDRLNPAGGILDDGDGTGRHANRDKKKTKSK